MTTLTAPHRVPGLSLPDRALLDLARRLEAYVARRAHRDRNGAREAAEAAYAEVRAAARASGALGVLPR